MGLKSFVMTTLLSGALQTLGGLLVLGVSWKTLEYYKSTQVVVQRVKPTDHALDYRKLFDNIK